MVAEEGTLRRFHLEPWRRFRLRQQLRATDDVSTYRHTLALLLLDRGRSIAEVADLLGVSRRSVELWRGRYLADPVPRSLIPGTSPGRPSLWQEDLRAVLRAALHQVPQDFGYQASTWTVPLLGRHLAQWSDPPPGDDTLRRQLHALGYVWKRPRYVLEPDPQRAAKMRRIRQRRKGLPPRSVLLFEDETDLLLFPPLRATWALRGRSAPVRLCGRNARRVLFGALNVETGTRLLLPRQHQRAGDFQALLRLVRGHYRGWNVVLVLDEDPSHTAKGSLRLAHQLRLTLWWLPKRCPELNAMDHLWRHGTAEICADRQYSTIEELVQRFIHYLMSLSPEEALRKAGVLSKDFWLDE
jgi:transposase